ncbi:S-adenosyl-L-methionine-dependent methyltransferase [Exidia glandulosa HHB12029]|uniref:S-adenosyl-L-methionine-dependent methyltransferase n=1 Tax=Exidia glandulosa HHB12029 TaxID=1314781 RepID=A0A165F683_EXIGL|nr:S-adenosyl-L-methionine-dependent methyltransferase [Exidia glandulosa HHB12029]
MTFADIKQLLSVLNTAVDALEANFKAQSLDFPSLDEPVEPESPAERATTSAEAREAIDLIVAAAAQLTATVRAPFTTLFEISGAAFLPSTLRFVLEVNTVEIIREAGEQGLHARDIAAKAEVDEQKIAHALRYLATHHVFREVAPDVFANNRISALLDTKKSVQDLKANSQMKYANTNAVAAFVNLQAKEILPITAKITDHWTGAETKYSREPDNTVINTWTGEKNMTIFQWLEKPENRLVAMSYVLAMAATGDASGESFESVLEGFEWANLKPGSIVVDVGGGVGKLMMPLYKTYPELKFEVQDRAQSLDQFNKIWDATFPDALPSKRVAFRVQDFLEPQAVKDAAVWFLRNIVHNWPDAYVIRILKHLRDVSAPSTRLVLADRVIPHATTGGASASELEASIPGAVPRPAPKPLLANFGRANSTVFGLDIGAQSMMNGLERTLEELVEVTSKSGWKIERVNRERGDLCHAYIVCVPV